ncbi:uncharacterized protein LOC110419859 isoform X2 [Herrania umbratica]|uniref:Uncharacterized protein LOC110419859 isoform X2 n=1 Tax=Herrania umbratica TaxID=108875 RepID=A0A6J1AP77_9ROSI|nr:uncharacterized protein LOC110419859 isoform X2 [Herrania umbratica]
MAQKPSRRALVTKSIIRIIKILEMVQNWQDIRIEDSLAKNGVQRPQDLLWINSEALQLMQTNSNNSRLELQVLNMNETALPAAMLLLVSDFDLRNRMWKRISCRCQVLPVCTIYSMHRDFGLLIFYAFKLLLHIWLIG